MEYQSDHKIKPKVEAFLTDLTARYPTLEYCLEAIRKSFLLFQSTLLNGQKLLVCGNGGSAADAEHFSAELLKGFLKKRPLSSKLKTELKMVGENDSSWVDKLQGALPVYPITMNGVLYSAVCNDIGNDLFFAQQLLGYGNPGDTLFAISTSGNSSNILKAVKVANLLGLHSVGLTGMDGGKLRSIAEETIRVPAHETYQIQELHLPIYHTLAAMLEEEFFG